MAWDPHGPVAAGTAPPGGQGGTDPAPGMAVGDPRGHHLGPLRGGFSPPARPAPPTPKPARPIARLGETSLGVDAATLAGLSYLGWWFTGLLIYFNERRNRFVRFHALQSVVYTGGLTIVAVLGYVVSALLGDLAQASHQRAFDTLARGGVLLTVVGVVFAWCIPLIAAWSGVRLRIPGIAPYAERYAAPAQPRADGDDAS